jgi:two-component system, NtrC family, response regulator AtoC
MSKPTIMIVEDEIVLSMELEEKLTDMGYAVVTRVTSGEDAVRKADELRPDLILMDIRLDGELDGIQAAGRIQARNHIPVLYLTAYADSKTLERAKLTEPFGYLVKPYSERELQITIDMALHKALMDKRLRESEERFRAVFETARDLMFIKDNALRYTHANPALLKFLGTTLPEVIGKRDEDLLSMGEAERSRELENRVLSGQIVELEHSIRHRGQLMTGNFVRVPLSDSSGRINGLFCIGRDVTERKIRERVSEPDADLEQPEQFVSAAMKNTLHHVSLAARVDSICLFLGESGVGKDFLARYLHDHSPRSSGPFFCINCAALPPDLAESELFGHEKGAFTGAAGRKRGLLELAEGGTLLLNEIGELSPKMQSKLLTFLDTKSFTRVGAEKNIFVNARLVVATNRNLEKEVEAGSFRKDLFYRISVITVRVPSLRERMEDLPTLVHALILSLARSIGLREIPTVTPEAMKVLSYYDWPGNIRELRNVMERALIHSDGQAITPAQIILDNKWRDDAIPSLLSLKIDLAEGTPLNVALKEAKKQLITESLRRSGGSVKDAAGSLGVSRDAFNYLMKSLKISRRQVSSE